MLGFILGFIGGYAMHYAVCKYREKCDCLEPASMKDIKSKLKKAKAKRGKK